MTHLISCSLGRCSSSFPESRWLMPESMCTMGARLSVYKDWTRRCECRGVIKRRGGQKDPREVDTKWRRVGKDIHSSRILQKDTCMAERCQSYSEKDTVQLLEC
jgi:hypothetical protein